MLDSKSIQSAIEEASSKIGRFQSGDILSVTPMGSDVIVFCSSAPIAQLVAALFDKNYIDSRIAGMADCWHIRVGEGAQSRRYALRPQRIVRVSNHHLLSPIMAPTTISKPDLLSLDSAYIQTYEKRFKARLGNKYVFDQHMRIVGLMPWMDWAELNKGQSSLGQTIDFLDEQIRVPRKAALELALETGEDQTFTYDYLDRDRGLTFSFVATLEVAPECNGEVLLVVQDNPKTLHRLDQRGYWLNWIATQERLNQG